MEREVRSINLSRGDFFRRLEDYFLMKGLRIIESYEPDSISARLGPWISVVGKIKSKYFYENTREG